MICRTKGVRAILQFDVSPHRTWLGCSGINREVPSPDLRMFLRVRSYAVQAHIMLSCVCLDDRVLE